MEWRKVKNIILLLLVIVNGFLLVLVAARREEASQYEHAAVTQAVQALANSGVQADEDDLTAADGLAPLSAERDIEAERRLAQALLGEEPAGGSRGGGLYLYQTAAGEVSFRPGGELSAALSDDPRWNASDPAAHAAGLLRQMDLEGEQISLTENGDRAAVTFRQLREDVPLYSCSVSFTYEGGRLREIAGTLLISGAVTQEAGTVLTLPTALMRFLDGILESGDVCSSILSMRAGYRTGQSFSGAAYLTPVWLVSTNTADYYLDASTGALTRLAER